MMKAAATTLIGLGILLGFRYVTYRRDGVGPTPLRRFADKLDSDRLRELNKFLLHAAKPVVAPLSKPGPKILNPATGNSVEDLSPPGVVKQIPDIARKVKPVLPLVTRPGYNMVRPRPAVYRFPLSDSAKARRLFDLYLDIRRGRKTPKNKTRQLERLEKRINALGGVIEVDTRSRTFRYNLVFPRRKLAGAALDRERRRGMKRPPYVPGVARAAVIRTGGGWGGG